jgi:hypothetical protein
VASWQLKWIKHKDNKYWILIFRIGSLGILQFVTSQILWWKNWDVRNCEHSNGSISMDFFYCVVSLESDLGTYSLCPCRKFQDQRYDMIERIHRFHDLISYRKIYQKSKKFGKRSNKGELSSCTLHISFFAIQESTSLNNLLNNANICL